MSGRAEVDSTGMKPKVGQRSMVLPITFDYSGGRRDKERVAKVWCWILGILGTIITIGTLFNRNRNFFANLALAGLIVLIVSLFIRFVLLKEAKLRYEKIQLKDSDGEISPESYWGIYDISDYKPYICRFRSGKSGVFITLNKDVILGKYSESEYAHYEAISDAYNICGSSNIQMCHMDYMDIIGSDERLDDSFKSLNRVSNPDVKDLLTSIYTYQKEQMSKRITSFDTFLFLWTCSDTQAWGTIQRVLSCFLQANFRSYTTLPKSEIRELTKKLYLLREYSVENAMLNAFSSGESRGIIPIKLVHYNGMEEIFNLTVEEKQEKAKLDAEVEELKKQELKRRKKDKSSTSDSEEFDLFEDN